jgi:hypothetical protein
MNDTRDDTTDVGEAAMPGTAAAGALIVLLLVWFLVFLHTRRMMMAANGERFWRFCLLSILMPLLCRLRKFVL